MGKLLVEEKEIVVPGQELADGMDYLPGDDTFRDKDKIVSMKLGIIGISGRLVKITPLVGPYIPKRGDLVIGDVVNVGIGGWRINIGWPFEASLNVRDAVSDFVNKGEDLSRWLDYGDYVMVQIINVAGTKIIDLSMKGPGLRKLGPGRIIKIGASKVPRVIGKQASMINLIKDYTGCKISVGQNGIVWLSGDDVKKELLAVKAIQKVEEESHITGLTERMKEFLEKNKDGI